jgi:hypothetical protein
VQLIATIKVSRSAEGGGQKGVGNAKFVGRSGVDEPCTYVIRPNENGQ